MIGMDVPLNCALVRASTYLIVGFYDDQTQTHIYQECKNNE